MGFIMLLLAGYVFGRTITEMFINIGRSESGKGKILVIMITLPEILFIILFLTQLHI